MKYLFVILCISYAFAYPQDHECLSKSGSCLPSASCPNHNYKSGLCPNAPNNVRCCFSAHKQDQECVSKGGSCLSSSDCTFGSTQSGLCPNAPWNIKCCLPSGSTGTVSGSCTVHSYQNSQFIGKRAYVEDGFRYAMDKMNSYAKSCGVQIYITSSFRVVGNMVNGAVVTPASQSNHHVGKAIDFNIAVNGRIVCNSSCLLRKSHSGAKCFLNKVQTGGLTWGGIWSTADPVHIDDRANRKSGYAAMKKLLVLRINPLTIDFNNDVQSSLKEIQFLRIQFSDVIPANNFLLFYRNGNLSINSTIYEELQQNELIWSVRSLNDIKLQIVEENIEIEIMHKISIDNINNLSIKFIPFNSKLIIQQANKQYDIFPIQIRNVNKESSFLKLMENRYSSYAIQWHYGNVFYNDILLRRNIGYIENVQQFNFVFAETSSINLLRSNFHLNINYLVYCTTTNDLDNTKRIIFMKNNVINFKNRPIINFAIHFRSTVINGYSFRANRHDACTNVVDLNNYFGYDRNYTSSKLVNKRMMVFECNYFIINELIGMWETKKVIWKLENVQKVTSQSSIDEVKEGKSYNKEVAIVMTCAIVLIIVGLFCWVLPIEKEELNTLERTHSTALSSIHDINERQLNLYTSSGSRKSKSNEEIVKLGGKLLKKKISSSIGKDLDKKVPWKHSEKKPFLDIFQENIRYIIVIDDNPETYCRKLSKRQIPSELGLKFIDILEDKDRKFIFHPTNYETGKEFKLFSTKSIIGIGSHSFRGCLKFYQISLPSSLRSVLILLKIIKICQNISNKCQIQFIGKKEKKSYKNVVDLFSKTYSHVVLKKTCRSFNDYY
ncbi:hypothetical protein SNEBB_005986 [Seison nebaliae]|nr:hypothetical protein SNEBB_005986 [Seison nebaliae]